MIKANSITGRSSAAALALAVALVVDLIPARAQEQATPPVPAQPAPAPAAAQPAAAAPTGRSMTLADVVAAAATQNPDLVIARTQVSAAERKVESAKGRRFPMVQLEGSVMRWNKPLNFEFSLPGIPPDPNAKPTSIRDQYTASLTARAVQPLSGLLVISKLIKSERAGLRAAHADVEQARLDVVAHAAKAFLGSLQARALRDIATQSISQLDAQLKQAQALASVGSLDQVDVMRLDAAKASAEQQLAEMEAAVHDADEGMLLILGMPLETEVQPVDNFPETLRPPSVDEAQAVATALHRPSLRAADARAVQAKGASDLAFSNLLPSINAIAQADHTEGQGTFSLKNSWFVGITLSWNIWDWGTNYYDMKAADQQVRAARLTAQRDRDRVSLEVRSAVRGSRAAYAKLDAAKRGAAAAEEAYRIQSVRFKEGALTTTDLLSAQVDATRARGALALARFEYLSAIVSVHRAMGQQPQLATTPSEGSK